MGRAWGLHMKRRVDASASELEESSAPRAAVIPVLLSLLSTGWQVEPREIFIFYLAANIK